MLPLNAGTGVGGGRIGRKLIGQGCRRCRTARNGWRQPGCERILALRDHRQRKGSCTIVAEHDGVLIGYVSGSVRTAFYAAGATAWVDEILVAPESRSCGVGRQLMSAFETWATRNDSVLVALATRGAAKFYEHLGYVSKAGYFKKYIAGDGTSSAESKS